MNRVLVLFAHPAFRRSRANRIMLRDLVTLDGVTVRDLYELYPDLDIDVQAEQEALLENDIIVFQHPFLWYSTPSVLKEWQDLVLEHGWAYGTGGDRIRGKRFLSALTTGGRGEAYGPDGYNRFTIRQLLAPLEQTANLCGMIYLPPFVVHGTFTMATEDLEDQRARYLEVVAALRDERIDIDATRGLEYLNDATIIAGGVS